MSEHAGSPGERSDQSDTVSEHAGSPGERSDQSDTVSEHAGSPGERSDQSDTVSEHAGSPGEHLAGELLRRGEIEIKGRLPWSSNGTFLVDLRLDGEAGAAVYKPLRGERPLWDYPTGLYRREVAVHLVSEALGWGLVPETVVRDGPFGPGSLQRFVPSHFEDHYFTMLERPELHDALQAICLFDLLVNNGDRKSGHCLRGEDGRVWAIDHGLCLHDEPKLRTVIWDFAGQPLPPGRLDAVARLAAAPLPELAGLLEPGEIEALCTRAAAVLRRPVFPVIRSSRAYPWPLV